MKVIYILWLRQLKRYVRSKSRMIGALGQPLLFLVALSFGFGPIYQKASGGSYLEFLAPGIIAMSIIFTSIAMGIEIIWDRQFGFLKETLVAPVSRMKIMIGRTLGGATIAIMQGLIVLLISMIGGFKVGTLASLPLVIFFMIITGIIFTAFGTAIASLLNDMQGFHLVMNFLIMPLFFLSGALFPLEGLPAPIRFVANLNPFSYCVDGLRATLIGTSHFGLAIDITVLPIIAVFFVAIGSYMFSRIEV